MDTISKKPLEVFYSYAPQDEVLREKLENQLGALKRQGLITDWHHRELIPGTERHTRVNKYLSTASIILLLVSPDFIASDYCYSNEMARALEQHNTGKARVIPIILRPTDYEGTPLETLQALPSDGKPVTGCHRSRDKAFLDIAQGIRRVIEDIHSASEQDTTLDLLSREYCQKVYERGKILDFKGVLLVNQNQPINIPLLDIFIPPKVLVGVPEYDTISRSQMDESLFSQELREEYEPVSRLQRNDASLWQEGGKRAAGEEIQVLSFQEQVPTHERHLTFHLEDLQQVLPKHRRLVLLGDPGSGKSTLLRYMMLLLAYDHKQFLAAFPSLMEEDLEVPLYLPLASYAEAWRRFAPGERSLKAFLDRYLCENYLDAYSEMISKQLVRGKVLLLFDGLDEIPDASLRLQIVQQVEMFTQTYPTNRFVLTSRIVGYREAPVSFASGYYSYVIAHFDEQQIQSFLQRWCPAYERWVNRNTDQQYLDHLATKEADAVFRLVHSRPSVRQLASNPFLLTLLALLQRQGTNLPAHRIELYELCAMTLLDTWGKTKGISTTTRFTRHELIKVLRPLAFWMHERSGVSAIPEEEVIEEVVKQLRNRKIARSEEEALKLAEEFLRKVRSETGILIERGKNRYGFLHLTFEEYFAAGELEQREDRKDFIKAHLHDPRWREVIMLSIGIPGIIHNKERVATEILRQAVLEAKSPFEHWLHRDLLLAGICLADDVGIDMECEDEIIERILCLVLTSPYDALVEKISRILALWQSTRLAEKAISMILPVLQQHNASLDPLVRIAHLSSRTSLHLLEQEVIHHYQTVMQLARESEEKLTRLRIMVPLCNQQIDKQEWIDYALTSSCDPAWRVREKAAELLSQLEDDRPEILQRLLDLLSDTDDNVRQAAARALCIREHREEVVTTKLLALLAESNWRSKQVAAEVFGQLGYKEPRIREQLLLLLKDTTTDVRQAAIKALWQLDRDQPEVIEQVFRLLSDTNVKVKQMVVELLGSWERVPSKAVERFFDLLSDEDHNVRYTAAQALGHLGSRQPEIVTRLQNILSTSDIQRREGAIRALGQIGQIEPLLLSRLLESLSSPHWQIRTAAAEALGHLGCEQPEILDRLLSLLSDPFPSVREAATGALGQVGNGQPMVVEKLLDLLYDPFPKVKQAAIRVLGSWRDEQREISEELLELLSNPDCLTVIEVIKVLGSRKETLPQVTKRLVELLSYPLNGVRQVTASVAGQLSCITPEVIEKLLDLLHDADEDVRQTAMKALKQLGNRYTEVLHFLSTALIETPEPALSSNVHILKGLDDRKKSLNQHITLRLLRVAKSLGNGHISLEKTLLDLLADPNSSVREVAAEALGELRSESTAIREHLHELLADHNSGVREAAIKSLGQLSGNQPETANALLLHLFDYDSDVQQSALEALQQEKNDLSDKIPIILNSFTRYYPLDGKYYHQYQQAATTFIKELMLYQPMTTSLLLHIISDRFADLQLQRVAAKALGYTNDGQSDLIQQLLTILFSSDSSLRMQESVITALGLLGADQPKVAEILLNFMPNSLTSWVLRQATARALGQLSSRQSEITARLFDFLDDSIIDVREIAIAALEHTGNREPETTARLLDFLSLPRQRTRTSAIEALGQLSDGQAEITEKLRELVSSTNSGERNAALVALARQSKEPMSVMDILLKSLRNPIEKRIWRTAVSYILESPEVDRMALSQHVEALLSDHEPVTKGYLTAVTQVERLFFTLQQSVGDVM